MRTYYSYMNDKAFLKKLDSLPIVEQYVRLTLLDFQENALETIEGLMTGGSLNKDGSSSVRRTCSLSCTVSPYTYKIDDIRAKYSLNKKVFIEIGIENTTDEWTDYDIIWMPQGVFYLATTTIATSGTGAINIALSLKDKMAGLDGTIGGTLPAAVQLDIVNDYSDSGEVTQKKVLVREMIIELVNHFGNEDLNNIVVDDVPLYAKRMVSWQGSSPLWIYQITSTIGGQEYVQYDAVKEDSIRLSDGTYPGIQFQNGENIGYMYQDFVYSDELTVAAGSTVAQALDTIKNWLGNYEYFYDEYGVFHFQEIKNYLNNTKSTYAWTDILEGSDYYYDTVDAASTYTFDDSNIISANNNPGYENIKNDFIILGKSDTSSGSASTIKYHLALDTKPSIDLNGYGNILLYTDPLTDKYDLTIPTIVDELPDYGKQNVYYGLLDQEEVTKQTVGIWKPLDIENEYTAAVEKHNENLSYITDIMTTSNGSAVRLYLFDKAAQLIDEDIANDSDSNTSEISKIMNLYLAAGYKRESTDLYNNLFSKLSFANGFKVYYNASNELDPLNYTLSPTNSNGSYINMLVNKINGYQDTINDCLLQLYNPYTYYLDESGNKVDADADYITKVNQGYMIRLYGPNAEELSDDEETLIVNSLLETSDTNTINDIIAEYGKALELAYLQGQLNELQDSLDTKENEKEEIEDQIEDWEREIDALETELSSINNQITYAVEGEEKTKLEASAASLKIELYGSSNGNADNITGDTCLYAILKALKASINSDSDISKTISSLNTSVSDKKKEVTVCQATVSNYTTKIADLKASRKTATSNRDTNLKFMNVCLQFTNSTIDTAALVNAEKSLQEAKDKLAKVKEQLESLTAAVDTAEKELMLLLNDKKHYSDEYSHRIATGESADSQELIYIKEQIDDLDDQISSKYKELNQAIEKQHESEQLILSQVETQLMVDEEEARVDYITILNSSSVPDGKEYFTPITVSSAEGIYNCPQILNYHDLIVTVDSNPIATNIELYNKLCGIYTDEDGNLDNDILPSNISAISNLSSWFNTNYLSSSSEIKSIDVSSTSNASDALKSQVSSLINSASNLSEASSRRSDLLYTMETKAYKNILSTTEYRKNLLTEDPVTISAPTKILIATMTAYFTGLFSHFYYWDNAWVEIDWTHYYADEPYDYIDYNNTLYTEALWFTQTDGEGNYNSTINMRVKSDWYQEYLADDTFAALRFDDSTAERYVANNWRTELVLQGLMSLYSGTETNYYYDELKSLWPLTYNYKTKAYYSEVKTSPYWVGGNYITYDINDSPTSYWEEELLYDENNELNYESAHLFYYEPIKAYARMVGQSYYNNTIQGSYFLDIIDSPFWSEYNIENIGRRTKVESNDNINCLFSQTPPMYAYIYTGGKTASEIADERTKLIELGFDEEKIININSTIYDNFATGGSDNAAFDSIRYNLLTNTTYQNSVSLTVRPSYYFEPNSRVTISSEASSIEGEYIVKSVGLQLSAGNSMSVSATKAIDKF